MVFGIWYETYQISSSTGPPVGPWSPLQCLENAEGCRPPVPFDAAFADWVAFWCLSRRLPTDSGSSEGSSSATVLTIPINHQ